MRLDNTFEDWRLSGSAVMFELLTMIQPKSFPPMNFLSKSEWNLLGKSPASDLKVSRSNVLYVEDKEDIP